MEVVRSPHDFPLQRIRAVDADYFYSYIVYIALIAGYLVLILFFFPETKYIFLLI